VDALSQFDTRYAMVERRNVASARHEEIDRYPSNGFLALEETLSARRKDAVGSREAMPKSTIHHQQP
jgi:NitT/TauT family transport system substrate-binding protein